MFPNDKKSRFFSVPMILLKNGECLFPRKVANIRLCGSFQIRLINLNVNVPSFLLSAINCLLCSNLVFLL